MYTVVIRNELKENKIFKKPFRLPRGENAQASRLGEEEKLSRHKETYSAASLVRSTSCR